MIEQTTFRVFFAFDFESPVDLTTDANDIVVSIINNGTVVLKYDLADDSGYDGEVTIDADVTKCYVTLTPDDAKKVFPGSLEAECHAELDHADYPDGLTINVRKRLTEVERTYHATE